MTQTWGTNSQKYWNENKINGTRKIKAQSQKVKLENNYIYKVKSSGLRTDRSNELNQYWTTKKGNLCNENDLTAS